MKRNRQPFADSVFLNCPFDDEYLPIFEAVVFTVVTAGFHPRCAVEELDSGTIRVRKIQELIRQSRYGIHDLSRVELGATNKLPRFNMPFELGLDIAAKFFGTGRLRQKRFLVLDSVPYRYQQFISDISGQDIECHDGSPDRAIAIVRDWLRVASGRSLPGPRRVQRLHAGFVKWLPRNCADKGFNRQDLNFLDFVEMAESWVNDGAAAAEPIERLGLDPLTELPNRNVIHEIVENSISPMRVSSPGDAVLLIDLDGLNRINERHGHLVGDLLLRRTAQALKQAIGKTHDIGRVAADEFLVVLRSDTPDATAALGERLRQVIATARVPTPAGSEVGVTASMGLVFLRHPRLQSADAVVAAADSALRRAKAAGGDRVTVFDPGAGLP